ncbi:sucrase ferredoxin [Pseudonocardia nematodicida]|uniref:Sucrase ferredoxin n=1 Tax=Pseudonocardia nematodicida TaxID=1206997 RepID=A0ABV1KBT6_9PSEU
MTAVPAPIRCSVAAEAAGDPLEGTAPPAQQWFLVEHPGPWAARALTGSGIEPGAVAALSAWAGAVGGRIALIRRPGRSSRVPRARRWFRVDSRPGHEAVRTGSFRDDGELIAAVGSPGEPADGPIALVCAHGRHDTCCAIRGRPLAGALAAALPDATWECSHVGGCRFAPAMVLLPHGFTFGGVRPDEAAGIVRDYARGVLEPGRLRGRSSLPPPVQAAQQHARTATGATGVDALRVVAADIDTGTDGEGGHRIEFADPSCRVRVRERIEQTDRALTCATTAPARLRVFDLVDLQV